jgi:hypothetical protein
MATLKTRELRVLVTPDPAPLFRDGFSHPLVDAIAPILHAARGNRTAIRVVDGEMGEEYILQPGESVQVRGVASGIELTAAAVGRNVVVVTSHGAAPFDARTIHAVEGPPTIQGAAGLVGRTICIPCGSDVSVR